MKAELRNRERVEITSETLSQDQPSTSNTMSDFSDEINTDNLTGKTNTEKTAENNISSDLKILKVDFENQLNDLFHDEEGDVGVVPSCSKISATNDFMDDSPDLCLLSLDDNSDRNSDDDDDELYKLLEDHDEENKRKKVMLKESDLFQNITLSVNRQPAEILYVTLKYALKNNLSISVVTDLLKIVNNIVDKTILPDSRFLIDRLCASDVNVTLHGVCPICSKYLGTFKDLGSAITCTVCETETDVSNPSNPCFFAFIDPSKAIRNLLELYESYYDFIVSQRQHKKNHVEDIYDGKLYRNFVNNLPNEDKHAYATAIFNTDGAAVFKSSRFSIWPLYIIVNEIPMQDRLKKSIVCGLFFGSQKPEMNIFLHVFVNNMNSLSTVGIPCTIKNEQRCIKVFCLVACVDTIARAPMNGTVQFNGKYGCDWCLQKGQHYGGSIRYAFVTSTLQYRDQESTILYAREALDKKEPVYGVKYASPLLRLNSFNIIHGFTPEYMHCYLAGVGLQFTDLIIKTLSDNDIINIDNMLKKIKAPHHVGRLTKVLSKRGEWKSKEYENWILYYSVPVLETIIDRGIMQHWCLLVESLHICLQTDIMYSQLNRANDLLFKFVSEVENLYSLNAMTYNVHQLLHIVVSIHNWGPLWSHSAFPFEAANHRLLKAIKSAKGVILQIVRHLNLQSYVDRLEKKIYSSDSGIVSDLYLNLLNSQTQKTLKITNVTYFGKGKPVVDNLKTIICVSDKALMFSKMVKDGCLFATSEKLNERSCNFFGQLINKTFIQIQRFIVDFDNNEELTICKIIEGRPHVNCQFLYEIISYSEPIAIKTSTINKVAVFVANNKKNYVTAVPNMLSY